MPGPVVPRIVVKIKDSVKLPPGDGFETTLRGTLPGLNGFMEKFPGLTFLKALRSVPDARIKGLVAKAQARDHDYDPPNLFYFYYVEVPPNRFSTESVLPRIQALPFVEFAYVQSGPMRPPIAPNDPRFQSEGHLQPAPGGIDAVYAWGSQGGKGAGIRFVDLEQGWSLKHDDLVAANITLISGENKDWRGHGTSVLGVIRAEENNGVGGVGIAPASKGRVVSQWRLPSDLNINTPDAILSALDVMAPRDVLLLEAQTEKYLPVEVERLVYHMIRFATALDVIVVEAGGNGANDLDAYADANGALILNRKKVYPPGTPSEFKDSRAIMVGAAESAPAHMWKVGSYGSRIDCYAWGENVDTLGDGGTSASTRVYNAYFDGTSAASAIIAGAAVVVQGLATFAGSPLGASQMRALLSNPANGTPSGDPQNKAIGVMPDLRKIIDGGAVGVVQGIAEVVPAPPSDSLGRRPTTRRQTRRKKSAATKKGTRKRKRPTAGGRRKKPAKRVRRSAGAKRPVRGRSRKPASRGRKHR
jgi:hypothetical protein